MLGLGSGAKLLGHSQTPALYWMNFTLREKAHKKKSLKISENLMDGLVSLGHVANVPAKMLFPKE